MILSSQDCILAAKTWPVLHLGLEKRAVWHLCVVFYQFRKRKRILAKSFLDAPVFSIIIVLFANPREKQREGGRERVDNTK